MVHIAFGTVTKCLLINGIVGIALAHARGQVVIIDGVDVVALHVGAVAEADVGIGLEVVLAVVAAIDETVETLFSGIIIGFLIVDVTEVVIGQRIFGKARRRLHFLELSQVFGSVLKVTQLIGRLAHPEASLRLVGRTLAAVHDFREVGLRPIVAAFLDIFNTCGIEQLVVNFLQR